MQKYADYTDEELIRLLQKADTAEVDAITDYIMAKYKPLVRKKSNALYLIGGENDDLIQEGMIGLFKAVRDYRFDKDSSFFHFAELCINRQLYSALEASNRKKHMPLNTYVSISAEQQPDGISMEESIFGHNQENPEQLVIEQELWEEFQRKLRNKLSKMEQRVLNLYLEGMPYTEIACMMEKSPKSIDNALQRIRQKIGTLKVGE